MSLDSLIHDVNSKCASLREAAPLLRGSPPDEARKLLVLMARQARALADAVESYEKGLPAA